MTDKILINKIVVNLVLLQKPGTKHSRLVTYTMVKRDERISIWAGIASQLW